MKTEYKKLLEKTLDLNLEILEVIKEIRSHRLSGRSIKSLDSVENVVTRFLKTYNIATDFSGKVLEKALELLKGVYEESVRQLDFCKDLLEKVKDSYDENIDHLVEDFDKEFIGEISEEEIEKVKERINQIIETTKEIISDCKELISGESDPMRIEVLNRTLERKNEDEKVFETLLNLDFKLFLRKDYDDLMEKLAESLENSKKALSLGKSLLLLKKRLGN